MLKHEAVDEARQTFLDEFGSAGDKFMAVVWGVKPDGDMYCSRTTFNFPRDRMLEAIGYLIKLCIAEQQVVDREQLLPLAPWLQSKISSGNGCNADRPDASVEVIDDEHEGEDGDV